MDMRATRRPRSYSFPLPPGWATTYQATIRISRTWLVVDGTGSVAVPADSVSVSSSGYVVYRVDRGTTTGAYVFRATPPTATNGTYLEWPVCSVTLAPNGNTIITARYHVGVYFFASVLG